MGFAFAFVHSYTRHLKPDTILKISIKSIQTGSWYLIIFCGKGFEHGKKCESITNMRAHQVRGEGEWAGDPDVGADPVEVADDRDERVAGLAQPKEVQPQAVRHVDHLRRKM